MSITDGFGLEKKEDNGISPFIKGADFDGEGLVLEVVGTEAVTPKDAQYGASNVYGTGGVVKKENYLIKSGVIAEGQSLRWKFKQDELEKIFDNHSAGFFIEMSKAKLEEGDKVSIKRIKGALPTDTKWEIKKV